MRRGIWVWVALVALGASTAALWTYGIYDDDGPSAGRLALGQQLYEAHCASCHGVGLEGEADWRQRRADGTLPAPPHDATGHTWHHPDQQLHAITKEGTAAFAPADYKTNMLGFGDLLSDDDIQAVLDYIKARWPAEIRARQAEMTRRAAAGD